MKKVQINIYKEQARAKLAEKIPTEGCIYVCIGTDKVLSDSLGPKVGTLLLDSMTKAAFVYGLEENNITALNLSSAYALIKTLHPDKKIVIVDAAVGDEHEVGSVLLEDGPLYPGAATKKKLPKIGDFSIIGIVSKRSAEDFYRKSAEREALIADMAQVICGAIVKAQKLGGKAIEA